MKQQIHIGTSGWSYQHWKQVFYPSSIKPAEWLSYYAQFFATTEINNSFYRLPDAATIYTWMENVPEDFIFCPKASRFLSHMKKLKDPEEPLERMFQIFQPLKKMMGPVLVQLPPNFGFNEERAAYFYALLKQHYSEYDFVLEVRRDDWLKKASVDLMKKYDVGLVISHSGTGIPYAEVVTSKNVYIRFHGPGKLYASAYPDALLKQYAKKMLHWQQQGHEVWAYFNNDMHGYAIFDALKLQEFVRK